VFLTSQEEYTRVVDSYYMKFLNRTENSNEQAEWVNFLLAHAGTRESVAEFFLSSDEYFADNT
jgi:hypothetical protein